MWVLIVLYIGTGYWQTCGLLGCDKQVVTNALSVSHLQFNFESDCKRVAEDMMNKFQANVVKVITDCVYVR